MAEKSIRKTTTGKGRNYRKASEGAGMTKAGVAAYRRANPGSKLKQAVTGRVKKEVRRQGEEKHFVLDHEAGLESVEKQLVNAGDVKKNYYYICYK